MTLSFRISTRADMELVDPILVAAYNFTGSRTAMLEWYWALQPDGWWLVSLDDKPVGFGGAVEYGPFSYVGMLCVHPSLQNRGIGTALVERILAWEDARGCPTLLLNAAERAVSLYRRSGFVEEGQVFQFVQQEQMAFSKASPGVSPFQASDIPEVAAFDALYFGANRAKILTSCLTENPERAFVSRTAEGQITGYIFAEMRSLGPWVASSIEDAEHLLAKALSLPFERNPGLTIPASNSDGQRLLNRYGFSQQGTDCYMRRGAPVPFRQLNMLYGEASPALG